MTGSIVVTGAFPSMSTSHAVRAERIIILRRPAEGKRLKSPRAAGLPGRRRGALLRYFLPSVQRMIASFDFRSRQCLRSAPVARAARACRRGPAAFGLSDAALALAPAACPAGPCVAACAIFVPASAVVV